MSKDLDAKVDQLEAAVDPNTVISVGGVNFTPAKLMIAGGIISSILGGLYGTFEVYKDYMSMKEAIQTYVAPDLSSINERMSVLEKQMEAIDFLNMETHIIGDFNINYSPNNNINKFSNSKWENAVLNLGFSQLVGYHLLLRG